MPPKKTKEDEIDTSSLPPWFAVSCVLKCLGKKARMQQLLDLVRGNPKSFQKNISRDDIVEFAKEKGLYTDPNTLNEKQRKDPKIMESLNLEINGSLIAKSFVALRAELDLKGRKTKKDKLEGKEEVDDKKADPKKKEAKKEAKKGGKGAAEVVKEEVEEKKEEVEPEKDYKKALDNIYFLLDFPAAQDELDALMSQTEGQLELCIEIREKVLWDKHDPDLTLLDPKDNFDEDLRNRMNNFIDADPEEEGEEGGSNGHRRKVKREVLDEHDLEFIELNRGFVNALRNARSSSERDAPIRRTVIKELIFEVDPNQEIESAKLFVDQLIETVCQFSFDSLEYDQWAIGKLQIPLELKEALHTREKLKEEEEKQRKLAEELAQQAALEEAENQKKKGAKKETKKETKKEGKKDDGKPEENAAGVKQDEAEKAAAEAAAAAAKHNEGASTKKDPFELYYRQLNDVTLEKTTAGILLECLLDQIDGEKAKRTPTTTSQDQSSNQQNGKSHQNSHEKANHHDSDEIDSILAGLGEFVKFEQTNALVPQAASLQLQENNRDVPLKDVIDESDSISSITHKCILENRDSITEREQNLFARLVFPGIDRNLMPSTAEKPKEVRKAAKSQMYPFISCSIDEFERRLTLTRFEAMLAEKEPEREWDFGDRTLMERFNSKTALSQTLFKALLWEPNVLTKYNEDDDTLQVALYYKNPPGRILRKRWDVNWKVFPNLENWIEFFKSNPTNFSNSLFYDLDYERIGNIQETTKFMFPNDNSVIFGTKFNVGGSQNYRYKVLKENVTFGIKPTAKSPNFWSHFTSGIQLLVELEDSPSAASAHATPQTRSVQQNAAAAASSSSQDLEDESQMPSSQMQQLQQQQIEEQQEAVSQAERKTTITLTLKNGLVVKFLPNGDVFQSKLEHEKRTHVKDFEDIVNPHEAQKPNSETENKRIVTGKGSVIKYMKDGSIVILYANGNTSFAQSKAANWITTNNKGLRRVRNAKDGSQQEIEPIPCTKKTDPESGSKITIRSDQTTIVQYLDGTVYTKHKDGTQMLTSPKKDVITIEHPDYSTVKVLFDEVKARTDTIIGLGSAFANVGFDNLFERSNNGIIIETYLPDGTKVIGYREKRELPGYDSYSTHQIHLAYLQDGSIAKIMDNGEVVLISAVDRVALNAAGENKVFGEDIDFWLQLFCVSEERKAGVYTVDMQKGVLWTRDDEGNMFGLHSNGNIDTKIAVSLNLAAETQDPNNPLDRPTTPQFKEKEFIEEENLFLPLPSTWVPVRLFTIHNNNTGSELLSKEQVANYQRIKEAERSCIRLVDEKVPSFENCKSITFISQLLCLQEKKVDHIKPVIPRNLDIIPTTEKKRETPEKKCYLYRNFLEFDVFGQEKRDQHSADLAKYENWRKQQLKQKQDFGVVLKSEEERDAEFNLQLKIMENRKKK